MLREMPDGPAVLSHSRRDQEDSDEIQVRNPDGGLNEGPQGILGPDPRGRRTLVQASVRARGDGLRQEGPDAPVVQAARYRDDH